MMSHPCLLLTLLLCLTSAALPRLVRVGALFTEDQKVGQNAQYTLLPFVYVFPGGGPFLVNLMAQGFFGVLHVKTLFDKAINLKGQTNISAKLLIS